VVSKRIFDARRLAASPPSEESELHAWKEGERALHLLEYWSLERYTSRHVEQARQPQIAVVALIKQHKPSNPHTDQLVASQPNNSSLLKSNTPKSSCHPVYLTKAVLLHPSSKLT